MRRFLPSTVFEWIVVAVALVVAWTIWNGRKDSNDSSAKAVLASKLHDDSLTRRADSIGFARGSALVDSSFAHGERVVERWHEVKVPVYLPATSTAHDTIQSFAKRLNACYATGDSLVASVVQIKTACSAFRDSATKTIADQRRAYAHLDSLNRLNTKERRLQLYGDFLYEPLKQRPVLGIEATSKLFWKLHAKTAVQFSVPHSATDSTAGFRWLVGGQLKF